MVSHKIMSTWKEGLVETIRSAEESFNLKASKNSFKREGKSEKRNLNI